MLTVKQVVKRYEDILKEEHTDLQKLVYDFFVLEANPDRTIYNLLANLFAYGPMDLVSLVFPEMLVQFVEDCHDIIDDKLVKLIKVHILRTMNHFKRIKKYLEQEKENT